MKVYTVSLGCPKNLVDTEIMLGCLSREGWEAVNDPRAASLLLVNTCAFIAPASQEAVDTILELARIKEADPAKILAVTGCLVQRYAPDLEGLLPEVDVFVGVQDFPQLPQILSRVREGHHRRLWYEARPYDYREPQPRLAATPRHLAYLKIAEGCSHGCTFCVIPRIRGPYRSRPLETLIKEALDLAAAGVKELILVAQDTTAYGRDRGGPGLADLLQELGRLPGFTWLRVLYSHPARITPELLEAMAAQPQVAPYLDIPIQHGHDEMLRRMGRGYSRKKVLDTCRLIREALPQAALRTSVMVGFPGETEDHFQALLDLVQEIRFDHLGVFLYSPEEGAPAAKFSDIVPRRVARTRANRLKALQARIVKEKLKALVGARQPVLVEGVSPESEYLLSGRLISQAPDIDGQVYITSGVGRAGEVQTVKITRALAYDLVGEIVTADERR
ncbi:MAG: 30S ribosomal protein S12 methylthiotransferase RimO [Deltaproteobacteria bacterium]|nr:30S ribosomal protein S12 methylthiotransferase RimO [Deltaproteobacteria bacterium]